MLFFYVEQLQIHQCARMSSTASSWPSLDLCRLGDPGFPYFSKLSVVSFVLFGFSKTVYHDGLDISGFFKTVHSFTRMFPFFFKLAARFFIDLVHVITLGFSNFRSQQSSPFWFADFSGFYSVSEDQVHPNHLDPDKNPRYQDLLINQESTWQQQISLISE